MRDGVGESRFARGQRWISETEPELGLGTVMQVEDGRVRIYYPASGEMRMYASKNAPVKRVRFRIGDSVITHDDHEFVVEALREEDDLIVYLGKGFELPEALLNDRISFHAAEDRLLNGFVDPAEDFELRKRTLELRHRQRKSAVRGFIGGRIDLIPHQLYIAHEVSSRQAPRVLLSDEVGLGKTIEAGLILHRLLLTGRVSRALVVVPDSLVHQWFVEMLRRFNVWLHIFDEERCEAIEAGAPESNPFLDDQLIICSLSFLVSSELRTRQAFAAGWDLLVVDEAHHLEWSQEKASPEYLVVEALSRVAEGLLLLTATPEQLGAVSHFARLRLLDPDRYSDFDAFEREPNDFEAIADLIDRLSSGKPLSQRDIASIRQRFAHDREGVDARLREISAGGLEANQMLIEDLLDLHGPGRVVFRNTRAAMSSFPARRTHFVLLDGDKTWIDRAAGEFDADVGLVPEPPPFDFDGDPRLDSLIDLLREIAPQKLLLICGSKDKALALHEALRERVNLKAGLFHEGLSLVQRDRNAAWFAEPDGAQLLICSEIGSEGRNFQFAHHLLLFDLPYRPEVLEQRIGRLDRIGQTEDIHLHVPYIKSSPQEALTRWYHEGLDAFETSLEAGERLRLQFGDRILNLARLFPDTDRSEVEPALKELNRATRQANEDLRRQVERGRDRLLELNSFRPLVADRLIDAIRGEDQNRELGAYMLDVFDRFDVGYDEFAPGVFRVVTRPETSAVFATIPDDGITITFNRKLALSREDYSFVTWDHPMVTESMDLVLDSERGNSSYAVYPYGEERLLLEGVFILEAVAENRLHVDRFLPSTPIFLAVDQQIKESSLDLTEGRFLHDGPADFLNNPDLVQEILPIMLQAISRRAELYAESTREEARMTAGRLLGHEIHRLKVLSRVNSNIREQEIEMTARLLDEVMEAITQSRMRLDALRVIRCGRMRDHGA